MIKKIDANKYGVVRYAISSIEDIADLPREVSVGSEAILVNEDGEKKFRLGSDGWVEVVEVKEYDEDKLRDMLEDAKVGYRGIEYETLEERLDRDFDNIYSVLDNRTYIEYEGCRITAEDSLNGLQKETVVKGRTLQNIVPTKIYNDSSCYRSLSSNARLNGTTVSCVASGEYENIYANLKEFNLVKQNTDYTIILTIHKNTLEGEGNLFTFSNKDQVSQAFDLTITSIRYGLSVGVYKFVGRLKNDISECNYLFRTSVNKGATSGEIEFSYCMFEGDYTQTPLEELPYIEGIESVGDKSKNLVNGGLEIGMISTEGVYSPYGRTLRTQLIEIKPNTQYRSSFDIEYVKSNTDSGAAHNRIIFFDENRNYISHIVNRTDFITPTNSKYLAWTMYSQFKTAVITQEAITKTKFQIEEGKTQTPYQEYYDGYKISGKSHGKNLFDANNPSNLYYDTYIGEGNGNITSASDCLTAMCKVKPNTTYCLSGGYDRNRVRFNDKNQKFINTISYPNGSIDFISVTTPTNCEYLYWYFGSERTADKTFHNIQIEETLTPTTYEPYKESTYSYILDEPLRSLPNGVCDEIDLEKGIVTRRVGKVVLDGSSDEKWEVWGAGINFMFMVPITNLKWKDGNPLLCDAFKCLPFAIIDEEGVFNGETGWMGFKISRTKLKSGSIDELREWLALNPITVWYELETPYTEPINPNEVILDTIRLKSYEPITHITSDNYLSPTIKTQVPSDFNAVVLGLKSNNEALASQVMSLRQTNDELEVTNREQDDVIDVTLLALDEVYGMIDEGEIETMSMGSPMVNVYVKMIKRGIKTLDEVPAKYRAEVEELI